MTESEFYIIKELSNNGNFTQRELSKKLGLSLGSVNYALKALIKKGYLKIQRFKDSDNKVKYIYVLTPKWVCEKTEVVKEFLKFKIEEYNRLQKEIEELKKDLEI